MSLFRRRTIFHAEEATPDPDDLKWRLRRRVLGVAAIGFLVVLGIPVARDLQNELLVRAEARRFAQWLLESRLLAAEARHSVSLQLLEDGQNWHRIFHAKGAGCEKDAPGPHQNWPSQNASWKLQVQQENGETISGRQLCLDPFQGLLLDSSPLGNGQLLLTAQQTVEGHAIAPAFILVSQFGTDLHLIAK